MDASDVVFTGPDLGQCALADCTQHASVTVDRREDWLPDPDEETANVCDHHAQTYPRP